MKIKCVVCGEYHEETRGLSFDGCGINDCSSYRRRIFTAGRADWDTVAKTVGPECAAGPQLARAWRLLLADLERQGFGDDDANVNGGDLVEVMGDWYQAMRNEVKP